MDLTVGVLGGGQLGRMMVQDATRIGVKIKILDAAGCPAMQINAEEGNVVGSFNDPEAITKLAKTVNVVTTEIEHVSAEALTDISSFVAVEPHYQTIATIQNKFKQKEYLQSYNIPLPEYREVKEKTQEEIARIGELFGYPFMLKSQTQAYDGKGNAAVRSPSDIPAALKSLGDRPLYAEKWAHFRAELAVMIVKTHDSVLSYPLVETVQENNICKIVYAPARDVPARISQKAQILAKRAVAAFEGKGVFGVELFWVDGGDEILLNEIAPRPHNSGHYTIEGCAVSQFEAHLRAILDLPISQEHLKMTSHSAVMLNILGGDSPNSHRTTAYQALKIPAARVHLYGKGDARPGRKMGHITITGNSMSECESKLQLLIEERSTTTKVSPRIAVIMGSGSDLERLKPGIALLEDHFGLAVEVAITSAHRTPDLMADFSAQAASRGICVIIAAAGGAAHLPGMSAAYTTLPVIGVPIQGKVLDGVDSIYSMVQMPPGVPLATVGVNNSVNAALLAARILAVTDAAVREKYESYVANMKAGVDKSREQLAVGWRDYVHRP